MKNTEKTPAPQPAKPALRIKVSRIANEHAPVPCSHVIF
jgi:hypothetical protein